LNEELWSRSVTSLERGPLFVISHSWPQIKIRKTRHLQIVIYENVDVSLYAATERCGIEKKYFEEMQTTNNKMYILDMEAHPSLVLNE
jgi:hypothetical protein